jgi:tetratricopeptide (TPR) repeat protein
MPGYSNFTPEQRAEIEGEARRAAERALELDPGSGLAVAILGNLESDLLMSLELLDRAVELAPNDSSLIMWAASMRLQTGVYREEALAMLEHAYRLDPLVGINNGMLGLAYLANGKFELGQRHVLRAQELGWSYIMPSLLQARLARGDAKAVLREADQAIESGGDRWSKAFRIQVNVMREVIAGNMNAEELYSLEQSLKLEGKTTNFKLAYLVLGQLDHYFDGWEDAIDRGAVELYTFRYIYIPGGRIIVEHPRFLETAERYGLIPFWETHGYPMGCERVEHDDGDRLSCTDWPE